MKKETSFSKYHALMKDTQGRYRTSSLFWETRNVLNEDRIEPIFTIKNKPYTVPSSNKKTLVTYPSLKEIYLSYDHVPGCEYEFALDLFGCWDHWKVLFNSATMRDHISEWREELAIRLKANAIKKIMEASNSESAIGVNAARYLADEGYLPRKVGHMTKEDKAKQLKIAAGVRDTLQEDMNRLGLEVFNGGK